MNPQLSTLLHHNQNFILYQTRVIHKSLPRLQSGLYMTDGTDHSLSPCFKIASLPNPPQNNPWVPLPNNQVPVFPQADKAFQSGSPLLQKVHPESIPCCILHLTAVFASYQNACTWLQWVPEYPSFVFGKLERLQQAPLAQVKPIFPPTNKIF